MAIWLVTGATAGFGEAITRRRIAAGDRVIGTGRREERLEALRADLGPAFLPVPLDVRGRAAVQTAIETLPAGWAEIDVLVNNAGLAVGTQKAWETDPEDWDRMIQTNTAGLAWVTRAVLPGMVARGRGHVVNLGSIAGHVAYPGGNAYGATKAFVAQFSQNLRADLHGTGIRVTLIEPAAARTEFSVVRFKGDAAKAEAVYQGFQPLGADDVAEAIDWAVRQPPHVDIARIELWPTAQAPGGPVYHRA